MSDRSIHIAGILLAFLLTALYGSTVSAETFAEEASSEGALPSTDEELRALADELGARTLQLFSESKFTDAIKAIERRLQVLRTLYPSSRCPAGHQDIVEALMHLASASRNTLQMGQAGKCCQEALDMALRLEARSGADEHGGLVASCYMQLGLLAELQRDAAGTLRSYAEAVSRYERYYANHKTTEFNVELPNALKSLAAALTNSGKLSSAAECWERADQLWKARLSNQTLDDLSPFELKVYSSFLTSRGEDLASSGELKKAIEYQEKAVAVNRHANRKGLHTSPYRTIVDLLGLGRTYERAGHLTLASDALTEAIEVCEQTGRIDPNPFWKKALATCLAHLAQTQVQLGNSRAAMQSAHRSRKLVEEVYSVSNSSDPGSIWDVATQYGLYSDVYADTGDYDEAKALAEKSLEMWKHLYYERHLPEAYRSLSLSLQRLTQVLLSQNENVAAMELAREAVDMQRAVYPLSAFPDGHPELLSSLYNTSFMHFAAGDLAGARRYGEEALQIWRRRISTNSEPRDRAEFAVLLQHIAVIHIEDRQYESAIRFYEETDSIYRDMERQGIVTAYDVALLRMRMARAYYFSGDWQRVKSLAKEGVSLCEGFFAPEEYPDGSPLLARVLLFGAEVMRTAGDGETAADWCVRGARMATAFQLEHMHGLSETEALNLLASDGLIEPMLLSICRASGAPAEDLYGLIWAQRGAVQRAMASRLALRRRIGSLTGETRRTLEEYQSLSGKLTRCLLHGGPESEEELKSLTRQKESLERSLAAAGAPGDDPKKEVGTPRELSARLPADTAFVDLVHYIDMPPGQTADGAPVPKRIARYAAFVMQNGRPLEWIDLGPAADIQVATGELRRQIADGSLQWSSNNRLRQLVWDRIERVLAPQVEWVYICPDAALTAVPWGALPGRNGDEPLLVRYGISLVPSGAFLLEQLTDTTAGDPTATSALLVGDVDFGSHPADAQAELQVAGRSAVCRDGDRYWPSLPSSRTEIERIAQVAGTRPVVSLAGTRASVGTVAAELPKSRWAHFATHGFFAAGPLKSSDAQGGIADEWDAQMLNPYRERVTARDRNPLLLSGLVLAGANVPAGDDGAGTSGVSAIMTADSISYLPLPGLELVVLSACETGLGDVAGGEGVLGLQRAFHTAGAKNVIASLWKIDDDATAVLMRLFYEKMWQEQKPPRQALREAQLHVYRTPGLIQQIQRERGIDPAKTSPIRKPSDPTIDTTPPRLWAAFLLSGCGR